MKKVQITNFNDAHKMRISNLKAKNEAAAQFI